MGQIDYSHEEKWSAESGISLADHKRKIMESRMNHLLSEMNKIIGSKNLTKSDIQAYIKELQKFLCVIEK